MSVEAGYVARAADRPVDLPEGERDGHFSHTATSAMPDFADRT